MQVSRIADRVTTVYRRVSIIKKLNFEEQVSRIADRVVTPVYFYEGPRDGAESLRGLPLDYPTTRKRAGDFYT